MNPIDPTPDAILAAHRRALARRAPWEGLWRDCFDHCLPGRPGQGAVPIFDGTGADAAEQLAASLLAELTPPWGNWFGFVPARDEDDAGQAAALEDSARQLAREFDRANFAVEMHQAFLDLVIAGTALLQVEEGAPGETAALRFTAIPLLEAALEEGPTGRLDTIFRRSTMTTASILARFPDAVLPKHLRQPEEGEPAKHAVIERVAPDARGFAWHAVMDDANGTPILLGHGRFAQSPYIAFRWLRAPGEIFGRSPVMKALPDMRTANKVVELTLKNASIAVAGIWQAEDDGVLNPANIRLTPGAIIAKAVGSAGLTPLAAPGKFDVSQLVLDDLRSRIRHAMLADRLGPANGARMTATEVLERSAEMARLLGAAYGRLQTELLTPLVLRAAAILRRRGLIPASHMPDGHHVAIAYRSPLAQVQARGDAANTLLWLEAVSKMGAEAAAIVDAPAAARSLARVLGVPPDLLRDPAAASPSPQTDA
jgi:hypothetical protein